MFFIATNSFVIKERDITFCYIPPLPTWNLAHILPEAKVDALKNINDGMRPHTLVAKLIQDVPSKTFEKNKYD